MISFVSVLIVRWEQLLQNVSETVHNATGLYFCYQIFLKSYTCCFVFNQTNSSVYSGLRDQMNKLRDSLANLQHVAEDEEQEKELDLRMKNIKVVLDVDVEDVDVDGEDVDVDGEEQEKELDLRMTSIKVVFFEQEISASGFITPTYRQSK